MKDRWHRQPSFLNRSILILDGLASLLDQSLLRQAEGQDGEPRFTMLETIREYALERLAEAGEENGRTAAARGVFRGHGRTCPAQPSRR